MFVSYLWDDLTIDKNEVNNLSLFDKVFSFSIVECEKYKFHYRPMFYNDQIIYPTRKRDMDLFYIGSYKPSRFDFLTRIKNKYCDSSIRMKFILRSSVFLFLSKLEHIKYRELFSFKAIPYAKMMQMMLSTKCAIELEHVGQTGLTTRPIECIATKTKIITTNKNITKYSLYDSNNVLIIDERNPIISVEWINTPYKELPVEIREEYSLSKFVRDLLS